MVRKIITIAFCVVILFAIGNGPHANAYSIYDEGNLSTTYVTYFRDVVSNIGFDDNYVAFRSGQNEYIMIVGKLEFNGTQISLAGDSATVYKFYQESSGYNSQYKYDVTTIQDFHLNVNNSIIYSDLGQFPELVARGDKYEMLNTVLLVVLLLSFVIYSLFRSR